MCLGQRVARTAGFARGNAMSQQWMQQDRVQSAAADVVQAGFLRRWAALFLDQLILSCGFYALLLVVLLVTGTAGVFAGLDLPETGQPPLSAVLVSLAMLLLYYLAAGLYYAWMESSRHQATVGKMALGIKVVDTQGARLSFGHALGRWFAAALSYLTLYIGFLMAAFTQNKQALHDLVAGTLVVDRWAFSEHPERQTRGPTGCLIAFGVVMALMVLLAVVAIVAAISLPAYQHYLARTQFAQLEAPLAELKGKVESHVDATAACPDNTTSGFGAPESYASAGISRIVVDEFETGFCGISVWMPPLRGSIERQFLVEFDPEDRIWYCTDKAAIATLPAWCN